MQGIKWQDGNRRSRSALPALALAMASLACAGFSGQAQAKSGKLGVYSGTVTVSGTNKVNRGVDTYRAEIKISLPLTDGNNNSATAEISDVDKPSATAMITQWDIAGKEAAPQMDGKTDSWHCSLAAPVEVPLMASGVLNLDYRQKTHSMSIALVSTKTVPLKCVHSRSGAYKKDQGVSLVIGTSVMGEPFVELPFTDAAQLKASYKLTPPAGSGFGPMEMVWDLRLGD